MIRQAVDRHEVQRYVASMRDALGSPELSDVTAAAAATLGIDGNPAEGMRRVIPAATAELASSGGAKGGPVPFMSRDPVHSLLQSELESKLRQQGVRDPTPQHRDLWSSIAHTVESLLHPIRFGPEDPGWVIDIARAVLARLADGNHGFNPQPAEHAISGDARLVIVGDWGTGLPRARAVASHMADDIGEALAQGREVHVIHLGDVYYSGTGEEVRRHVLADGLWPVTAAQARAGVTSWSLNGNHDMYGGGFGYFETLLADPRFVTQRSADGRTTSFFHLSSPTWDFVGLDTSWDTDVLSAGQAGVLADPQAAFVKQVAGASSKKLCLLSHHQLLSVYSPGDLGPVLPVKLKPVLDSGQVTAWIWGHEHRGMGFEAAGGVAHPRCIGHGGVPVPMDHPADAAVPAPGAWELRASFPDQGENWARFGHAVLDLGDHAIAVRYRDDEGTIVRTESIG